MQEQKYFCEDKTYSAWHRRNSTRRFVGIENAQKLAMIDLDAVLYVEYDDETKEPLALIETAMDIDQPYKNATVTTNLAKRANLPCYVLLYKLSSDLNLADPRTALCNKKIYDIESFRVMRRHPDPEYCWRHLTPKEWAEELLQMRESQAKKVDKIWNAI